MANPYLDQLYSGLIPYIEQQLKKHGSFYPYSAIIDKDGKMVMVASWGEDDFPKSQEVIDHYNRVLAQEAKQNNILAGVIGFDVKLKKEDKKFDAIQFNLENANGESIKVFLPYQIQDKEIVYEEAWKEEKPIEWFVS